MYIYYIYNLYIYVYTGIIYIHIYIYTYIYVIIKTMGPPGYHHNGFAATHALGQMMYNAQVHELPQNHCGDDREGTLFS